MKKLLLLAFLLCCLAAHATTATCGYTTIGSSFGTGQNFEASLIKCIPTVNSTVVDLQLYIGIAGSGAIGVGIADSDGAAGIPGTILCSGTIAVPVGTSWNVATLSGCPTLISNHVYWLVRLLGGATTTTATNTGTYVGYFFSQTAPTLVNFPGSPSTTGVSLESEYLDLTSVSSTCGYPTIGTSGASSGTNLEAGITQCIPAANSAVTDCQMYLTTGGADQAGCAVVDSDGAGGKPGTVLCSGLNSSLYVGITWNVIPMSGCPTLLAGHTYWLTRNFNTGTGLYNTTGIGVVGYYFSQTCCSFVNFPGSPSSTGVQKDSIYLDVTPAANSHRRGFVITSQSSGPAVALPDLAPTPMMGAPTFQTHGAPTSEVDARAQMDALVSSGLAALGYVYVRPDVGWTNHRDASPPFELVTDLTLWPDGMKVGLCDYGHAKSPPLRCVMYYGTGASDISACNHYPGSTTWEAIDMAQAATFGTDEAFMDNCYFVVDSLEAQAYLAMWWAIQATTARRMVYGGSISAGPVDGQTAVWAATAGMNEVFTYPTYNDPGPLSWGTLKSTIDWQYGLEVYSKIGRWNTPGFLWAPPTVGSLTDAEFRSQFSLFSVFASPLWLLGDLTGLGSASMTTVSNTDVIAIDQDPCGIQGKRVSRVSCGSANCECYARPLCSSKWAVVGWNRDSSPQSITCNWSDFGGASSYTGHDDIAHTSLGTLTGGYTATVASHDSFTITLTP